jgi:hypothetical protein
MCRKKWRLTRSEQLEHRQLIEMLRAGGADLDLPAGMPSSPPWLIVEHSPLSGRANVVGMDTIFSLWVRIVVKASRMIIEAEVSAPEWDEDVFLVDEPRRVSCSHSPRYVFADGSSFGLDQVLNHRLDGHETLCRGDVLEGLILAQGLSPLPPNYPEGSRVKIELSLRNQFGDWHQSNVAVPVRRPQARVRPMTPAHRGSGLYDVEEQMNDSAVSTEHRVEARTKLDPQAIDAP